MAYPVTCVWGVGAKSLVPLGIRAVVRGTHKRGCGHSLVVPNFSGTRWNPSVDNAGQLKERYVTTTA